MPALLGGYQLLSRIGVGGMAEVFLARKLQPDGSEERVALKRILPHLAGQPDFVKMFLEEAALSARLSHPHIVKVHDFGLDGADYYLAMEHVAGTDLAALIARGRARKEPIALAELGALLSHACEALHHAHEQGIIHRDVTPSNLLVSSDGIVKLADFGIAKAEARAQQTWNRSRVLKGKIGYMSPEQVSGAPIDRRTDVWSLGVCAWELACGQRPPGARRAIPPALEKILLCALARDPSARWPTARAFGEALSAWLVSARLDPSRVRLEGYLTRLFGAELAERARLDEPPRERTEPHQSRLGEV